MTVAQPSNLTAFAARKRPTQTVRLARAARVLRRFDLQMLMLTAQVPNVRKVRQWIDVHVEAGDIVGPRPRGLRTVAGLEWCVR